MYIRFIHSFSVVLLITLFYCSAPPEPELETIEVPGKSDADIKLSDIAISIDLIQLETAYGAYISLIWDVKNFNGNLYIKDLNRQILIFNSEGKFIRNLAKTGDGPGELKFVNSMAINQESGLIYISSQYKILVYSKDHEYLEEKSLPFRSNYLTVLDNKLYAVSEFAMKPVDTGFSNGSTLLEIDSHLLEIKDSISLRNVILEKQIVTGYPFRNFISSIGSDHYIYTPVLPQENILRDTLYQLKDNKLFPHLKLNFKKPYFDSEGVKTTLIFNIINSNSYIYAIIFWTAIK